MSRPSILVPTDFSRYATEAMRMVTALAQASDAPLLILHVDANPEIPGADEFDLANPVENLLHDRLKAVTPNCTNVRFEHRFAKGRPSEAILHLCDKENVAMVVMGLHGQTNSPDALMGSVAQAVSRRCSKALLLVRGAA